MISVSKMHMVHTGIIAGDNQERKQHGENVVDLGSKLVQQVFEHIDNSSTVACASWSRPQERTANLRFHA